MNGYTDYLELFELEKRKKLKRNFSRFFIALFFYLLISYAVMLVLEAVILLKYGAEGAINIFNNTYFQWLLSVGPMYLIGFPVFLLIVLSMKSEKRERKKLKTGEFFSVLLICQALTMLGSIIGSTVTGVIGSILGHDIGSQTTELIENSPLWLIFAVAVILAPIIEELIFRKLLIDKLSRYGDRVAILVSGIAFGLFHGNFEQFFYAAMLGMLFAFVYTKTGNVIHTVLLHMAVNLLGSVIALPVTRASYRIYDYMAGIYEYESMLQYTRDSMIVSSYSILQYASVAAGVFIAVSALKSKKIQIPDNSKVYLKRGELAAGIFFNVGVILFLLFALLQFLLSVFFV